MAMYLGHDKVSGSFGDTYEYVISSKIVNGKIPDYFGGVLEKSSAIVSS